MKNMVEKCVCFDVRFADLHCIAEERGATNVEELQRYVQFGKNCGLCVPYVNVVLYRGLTVLPVLQPERSARHDRGESESK